MIPKPPSPRPPVRASADHAADPADPPPPYSDYPRTQRTRIRAPPQHAAPREPAGSLAYAVGGRALAEAIPHAGERERYAVTEDGDDANERTALLRLSSRHSGRRSSVSTTASSVVSRSSSTDDPPHTTRQRIAHYFRPLRHRLYYRALFHLLVLNFPIATVAWVYLFVGTLVGTTLLLTLPLGCLIWWLTLFGARALTRFELAVQSKFHRPLLTDIPPPRPIFYRISAPEAPAHPSDIEDNTPHEPSFLRNTYFMFLDPTSYQPLFYFIVIKASIALLLTPILIAVVPVSFVLILPAPAMLRLVRKIGLWQANVAVEGLT
ncbi:hypothetical protein BOTBODRAFT_180911 [Botryobasidium botryosum FD-172 SS1]|uniref:Sensor domain-containing protein n=1 Tax=Botryobasidium botryosum (strain FD-172 SS1) TaxID=930990 RepID=A0A067LVG8_BOTB1|nr:hypothetical protein BOTBODRAFT_180911 [Botryobasidium botryosum FD-172 SS1]